MLLFEMLLNSSAVETLNFGLFTGGRISTPTILASTTKYTYSDDTVSAGTNLTTNTNFHGAAGTYDIGLFGGGAVQLNALVTTTYKYTYSGDTIAAGTDLLYARFSMGVTGTPTLALFAGGAINLGGVDPPATANTCKYTYSGDTVSVGTSLSTAVRELAATGTTTTGYFGGGAANNSTIYRTVSKYTYSGDSIVSGTNLTAARVLLSATGTSTVGYFGGGSTLSAGTGYDTTATVYKYTYSGDTVASGTNLTISRYRAIATGSKTIGYFCCGVISSSNYSNASSKYVYSNDTTASGTNLLYAVSGGAAPGSCPASFS